MKIKNLLNRAIYIYRNNGIYYGIITLLNLIIFNIFIKFKSSRTFQFQVNFYNYFYHWYNATWKNERAIEIPIIWEIVKKYNGKSVLEVGNVLSHYYKVNYDIVDKYEKAEGVINEDVVDFKSSKLYDLIISISTLEHVGWDEVPRESMKILKAIKKLKSILTSEGKIVITLPLGYNPELDWLLNENKLQFDERYCFKRISKNNEWKQVHWDDIHNSKYGYPFPFANALIIGILTH